MVDCLTSVQKVIGLTPVERTNLFHDNQCFMVASIQNKLEMANVCS